MSRGALVVVLLAALTFPGVAAAAELLEPADAAELAQGLADAQDDQGVCYGWEVAGDATSIGSSTQGPGQALVPDPALCPRGTVVLRGSVVYECSTCDTGDRADVVIDSSLARPPTVAELRKLGLDPGGLTGEDDDQALFDLVDALPLLVAEHGQAPFVQYEAAPAAEVPAADRPTGAPGSDTLRTIAGPLTIGIFLLLAGVGYFFYKRGQTRA